MAKPKANKKLAAVLGVASLASCTVPDWNQYSPPSNDSNYTTYDPNKDSLQERRPERELTLGGEIIQSGSLERVSPGDTLWSIATRTLGNGKEHPQISALNSAIDANSLKEGYYIQVPRGGQISAEHDLRHDYYRIGSGDRTYGLCGELERDNNLRYKLELVNPGVDLDDLQAGHIIRTPEGLLRRPEAPAQSSANSGLYHGGEPSYGGDSGSRGGSGRVSRATNRGEQSDWEVATGASEAQVSGNYNRRIEPDVTITNESSSTEEAITRSPERTAAQTTQPEHVPTPKERTPEPSAPPAPTTSPTPLASGLLATDIKIIQVQRGDNLYKIANRTLGDGNRHPEIATLNPNIDPNRIEIGTFLQLPDDARTSAQGVERFYRIRPGDTLSEISQEALGTVRRLGEIQQLNPGIDARDLNINDIIKVSGTIPLTDSAPEAPNTSAAPGLRISDIASKPLIRALNFVLQDDIEGGYANDPVDRGGATNLGVTEGVYKKWRKDNGLAPKDIKDITKGEAIKIYRDLYWNVANCDSFPERLAVAHFDTAVNMGPGGAKAVLRQAAKSIGLSINGNTYSGANIRKICEADQDKLLEAYYDKRIQRYRGIVQRNPSQKRFYKGWLRRVRDLRAELRE